LARKTDLDKIHFLIISNGSLSEIDTQLEIALNLKYIDTTIFESLENKISVVQKLLGGIIRKIKQ
jgi:four helix bundle protein